MQRINQQTKMQSNIVLNSGHGDFTSQSVVAKIPAKNIDLLSVNKAAFKLAKKVGSSYITHPYLKQNIRKECKALAMDSYENMHGSSNLSNCDIKTYKLFNNSFILFLITLNIECSLLDMFGIPILKVNAL